jgi:hypothetical protein
MPSQPQASVAAIAMYGIGVGADDAVLDPRAPRRRHRHADADGAVVGAPVDVDRRRGVAGQAPVAVDVRREQRHRRRDVALQAADVPAELGLGSPASVLKMLRPLARSTMLWCTCIALPGSPRAAWP